MNFYCDKCQTKYSIADEKVRGKVLKVRCKKCSNVITVREPDSPAYAEATVEMSSGGLGQRVNRHEGGAADNALAGAAAAARVRARLSSASSPSARAASSASSVSWHYSVNGESFGPFTFEHLRSQFASAKLTDAAYVWNETFTDWKPVGEVAEFAAALDSGKVVRPKQSTLGVSGGFQAIKLEDYRADIAKKADDDAKQDLSAELPEATVDLKKDLGFSFDKKQSDQVSALLDETTLKEPSIGSDEFPTLVETRSPDIDLGVEASADHLQAPPAATQASDEAERETLKGDLSLAVAKERRQSESASERLQRLRDRLKSSDSSLTAKPKEADLAFSDTAEHGSEDEFEERTVELAGEVSDAESELTSEVTYRDSAFLLEKPEKQADESEALLDALEETTLRDDAASLKAAVDVADAADIDIDSDAVGFFGDDAAEESSDADAVPFFPAAPKLGASHGYEKPAEEAYSGSLLIELDKLKKEQRSKFVWIGVAAAVLVAVVGAVIVWISSVETPEKPTQVAETKEEARELVFRRYSKEEQGRIRNLIEIPDEVVADSAEPGSVEKPASKPVEQKPAAVIEPRVAKNTPAVVAPVAEKTAPAVDPFEAAMRGASSHNPVDTNRGVQRNDGSVSAGIKTPSTSASAKADGLEDDKFKAFAAIQMPSGDAPIYQPSDALKNRNQRSAQDSGGLTDAQASAGFQTVRQSIGLCRERTMQRGLKIDVDKIYITLEIQPTGKVSSYTVEPASVRGTEFDRCMVSHTSRWKFASYSGEVTLIKAPFILQ